MADPVKYRCAACDEEFLTARPDAEAKAEMETLFPGVASEDCDIVCDDCFKAMGFQEP